MKEWISTGGPLEACFTVYDDFNSYTSGIYTHVTGNRAGGHCVCCVGYNDTDKYWICKNSWGPGFGESGYFRIAYGECGIDSWMDAIEGVSCPEGSLRKIFEAKGISFPVNISTVAQEFGLTPPPISVRKLIEILLGLYGVSIVHGASILTETPFKPNPMPVSVGDTVTWTNDDSQPHTVTSGQNGHPDGKFNSSPNLTALIAPGQTFEHKFTEAGQYPYYCALHPNMVGTVSVS
jgi:plastocyanin